MTVFTITYNEELMLPHFIKHYRDRFADCKIVVYDNESTDRTKEIAKENGCEVITYKTNNELDDLMYLTIKNTCWKHYQDWVIVADCDELFDVSATDILFEESNGVSVLLSKGYNMVNMNDNLDIESIKMGVRSESYDKIYCFDTRKVMGINYQAGAHSCNPLGAIKFSEKRYICRHYKYINIDYMINRHATFAKRLSQINKQMGYGCHYRYTAKRIKEEFEEARTKSTII